jgi:D-3-phosphoglycerate dehydrogenase
MTHILVAGRLHQAGVDLLKSASGITFKLIDEISLDSYAPHVGEADAILLRTQPLTAELVAKAPSLKIVSRHGVGYDAVDVKALTARNIPLAIVGDVNSRAVAEHTLMLMLSAARRTVAHDHAARSGDWNIRNAFETTELDGKHLLLLGLGRIGRRVAQLAQAFGMRVTAYDPFVTREAMESLGVANAATIHEALPLADYISLHVPLSPKGPVIGPSELALMKPSAIIVNAARGGLVDEMALDQALRQGRLAAAALDVLAEEPPASSHPLLSNPKVTISPHSAGLTAECAARMAISSVQNILDFFEGRLSPTLIVNASDLTL